LWHAQLGKVEPIDCERDGDRVREDTADESCLAGIFRRLHRLHRPPPPSGELSARERLLVQESARAAAHAVAREAADAATRALAPNVARELARVVLRDVSGAKRE
jgi:hypothetical protein